MTGLHWAAYNAHADIVKLLLERKAPVHVKDESYGGTPLGWTLYGWAEPAAEGQRGHYHGVVTLLVGAGATVESVWLADEKVRSDPRMLAALSGEIPAK